MTTWNELFDNFTNESLLYREKLPITDQAWMQDVSRALQDMQRRTKYVTRTKTLNRTGATENRGVYPLGDDVLEILLVNDADNIQAVSTSMRQNQVQMEQEGLSLNEVPFNRSLKALIPRREGWGMENRLFRVHNNEVHISPDPLAPVTLHYVLDIGYFSPTAAYWAAWFPYTANFAPQFTQKIPDELSPYVAGIVPYTVMRYLKRLLTPNYQVYAQDYEQEVQILLSNKQQFFTEGTAPYNISPMQ